MMWGKSRRECASLQSYDFPTVRNGPIRLVDCVVCRNLVCGEIEMYGFPSCLYAWVQKQAISADS